MESDAISAYIVSALNWISGHSAGVLEVLGSVGEITTHTHWNRIQEPRRAAMKMLKHCFMVQIHEVIFKGLALE